MHKSRQDQLVMLVRKVQENYDDHSDMRAQHP